MLVDTIRVRAAMAFLGAACLSACGSSTGPPLPAVPTAGDAAQGAATPAGSGTATSAAPLPTLRDAGAGGLQVAPDSLAWSPAGDVLAFATRDGAFFLTDGETERRVVGASLEGVGRPFVRWSPNGNALLAGGAWFDGTAVFTGLWHVTVTEGLAGAAVAVVPPSQVISTVSGNTGAVHTADWARNGERFAYSYRAEAWVAAAGVEPTRLTHLTEIPLDRGGSSPPFDGVRSVAFSPSGDALALELSCGCGAPWSGAAVLHFEPSDGPILVRDGMTMTGWSADGRIVGQNTYADWTPQATVDGYAVPEDTGDAENLTSSNAGVDALSEQASSAPPSPMQTGPIEWDVGPQGSGEGGSSAYLYPLFVYDDGAAPHRGFATRSASGAPAVERIGSAEVWFVAPRWLEDGRLAYVEAAPGPAALMILRRAVVENGPPARAGAALALELEGLASAATFSPSGSRLAVVEASVGGTNDVVRILDLPR